MNTSFNLSQHLDPFCEQLSKSGKQPATIESYRRDAGRFLDYLPETTNINDISPQLLSSYQQALALSNERANSIRRTVIGIRQFFRFVATRENWDSSPFDEALIPTRIDNLQSPLELEDVECLFESLTGMPNSLKVSRDSAIIGLLAFDGVKATELVNLKISDVLVTNQVTLKISGPKSRSICLDNESAIYLKSYYSRLTTLHNTANSGKVSNGSLKKSETSLFVGFKGRDASVVLPALTRHGLKFLLYELGQQSGIPKLNSELLRQYSVKHLVAKGFETEKIMQHLGLKTPGLIARIRSVCERPASQ